MKKIVYLFLAYSSLFGNTLYLGNVANNGNGTFSNPFNNFTDALNAAYPGDTISVFYSTYQINNEISTIRNGTANQRITVKAFDPSNRPQIKKSGRVVTIDHDYFLFDGFVFDGEYGNNDVVRIKSADYTILKNCEVKNSLRDGIDLSDSDNVLIENCEIHHMLAGSYNNQQDAHGIVATGEKNLMVRNCNIYYVTGDCFQTDPDRGVPLWDNVIIENCKLWTGPLPSNAAGWSAGEIPGENAIDTKINPDSVNSGYRPKIWIKNVEAYGFVQGYISNRAPFNIKENIECKIEAVRVYDNEIAFRLRGPGSRGGAHVTIINSIAYNNDKVFRVEDDLELLHVYNCTFDKNSNDDYFQNVAGGYDPNGLDLRNCLFTGAKPPEASHSTNMTANASFFINMANNDFHLSYNSQAIDVGDDIQEVIVDYDGNPRISGMYDIGAFEYISTTEIYIVNNYFNPPLHLRQNYPNPFNPSTTVEFEITDKIKNNLKSVSLNIYTINGELVRQLFSESVVPGIYKIQWDGKNESNQKVGSGTYIYCLSNSSFAESKKMILLR